MASVIIILQSAGPAGRQGISYRFCGEKATEIHRGSIDRNGKKVDKILQRSATATQSFKVDIGEPKKARGKKGAKNPYGL